MSRPTRRWTTAAAIWLCGWFMLGTTWDGTFEGSPAGTDLVSTLDTVIQQLKREIRARSSPEIISGTGSDDNGLMRLGSARAFVQNAAPTDIAGPGQYNAAATPATGPLVFGGTPLTTEELGGSTSDIGAGRLWVDLDGPDNAAGTTDDNELNIWNETSNSFVDVTAVPSIERVGNNLIYNGSFEVTDGTGSAASTTVAQGWANLNTADIAYDSINDSTEGDGLAMETIANGGADEGATQTLAGLKESTTYVLRARVRPVVGTCSIVTTGGATNASDTSAAASGVFETLEGTFATDATPTSVVVRLESNVAADECDWDHVTVFERNALVSPPGVQVCRVTEGTVAANYYNDAGWTTVGTTCTITVPAPGMVITARGTVLADEDNAAADGSFVVRMQENINGGGAATVALGAENVRIGGVMSVDVSFTRASPAPGSVFVYTLDGQTDVGGGLDRNWDGAEAQGETPFSMLEVMLLPAR